MQGLHHGTAFALLRRRPGGDRKAPWSPPQRRKLLKNRKKKERLFPLPPQETCLLWEVSPACGRTRYFPRAGKYPKGAGGVQRVHVSWPPPDPPLLSNSAPLASQGRAQLVLHPFPGGPLSPSAQLIPPPAPGRRFILGVMARDRHGREILLRYVPRLMCHAKCVPAAAPD